MRGVEKKSPRSKLIAPTSLSKGATAVWNMIVDAHAPDWFVVSDEPVMAAYCQTYVDWAQAVAEFVGVDCTYTDHNGTIKPHPLIGITKGYTAQISVLAQKLRLAPSARYDVLKAAKQKNMPAPPVTKEDQDKMDLLGG